MLFITVLAKCLVKVVLTTATVTLIAFVCLMVREIYEIVKGDK